MDRNPYESPRETGGAPPRPNRWRHIIERIERWAIRGTMFFFAMVLFVSFHMLFYPPPIRQWTALKTAAIGALGLVLTFCLDWYQRAKSADDPPADAA